MFQSVQEVFAQQQVDSLPRQQGHRHLAQECGQDTRRRHSRAGLSTK